jgi:hypothetical protein
MAALAGLAIGVGRAARLALMAMTALPSLAVGGGAALPRDAAGRALPRAGAARRDAARRGGRRRRAGRRAACARRAGGACRARAASAAAGAGGPDESEREGDQRGDPEERRRRRGGSRGAILRSSRGRGGLQARRDEPGPAQRDSAGSSCISAWCAVRDGSYPGEEPRSARVARTNASPGRAARRRELDLQRDGRCDLRRDGRWGPGDVARAAGGALPVSPAALDAGDDAISAQSSIAG